MRSGKSLAGLSWCKYNLQQGHNVFITTADVNASFDRLDKFGLKGVLQEKGYIKLELKE